MTNRLNIPQDLNALIEKREGSDRRQENEGEAAQADVIAEDANKPLTAKKQRSGKERRDHISE